MPVPEPYRLIPASPDRRGEMVDLEAMVFPTTSSREDRLAAPDTLTWDRAWAIERDGALMATGATHPLRGFSVPGGLVSCGWLAHIGVHPAHRRRGLLRAMVEEHLAGCRDHGEVVSGLFASEPAIYGRFGYGLASRHVELRLPRQARLRPFTPAAELHVEIAEWDPQAHADLVAELHQRSSTLPAGVGRPGWATWETPGLRAMRAVDQPAFRGGLEPRKIVLIRDERQRVCGYATFRREGSWQPTGPQGTVHVADLVGMTPSASYRLWQVLLDLDLMTEVRTPMLAVDDPLLEWLVDIRQAEARLQDNVWLRIVDVAGALRQRRLAGDVDVVVEVADELVPSNAGCWRIHGNAWQHPQVDPAEAPADLRLDIRELSAAYLGATSMTSLAQAGLITVVNPDVLGPWAAAMGWPVAPVTNWIF